MRKTLCAAAAVLLALSCHGCSGASILSNYREIEDLEIIRTLGADYNSQGIQVTACTGLTGTDSAPRIYGQSAHSIGIALDKLQKLPLGKSALFSHTENLLIGQDQAQAGIAPILDYLERNSDTRMDITPFVVKGGDARELISGATGGSTSCTDMLASLRESAPYLGSGWPYSCRDVAASLAGRDCALIMAVEGVEEEKLFEDRGDMNILPVGFALLSSPGTLETFLDREQTLGTLMATGRLRSFETELSWEDSPLTLLLTGSQCSVEPSFEGGRLSEINVEITARGSIVNAGQGASLWRESFILSAQRALEGQIYGWVSSALELSAETGLDFMDLLGRAERAEPVPYRRAAAASSPSIDNVEIGLSVTGLIERTYDINDPVDIREGEEESFWEKAREFLQGS